MNIQSAINRAVFAPRDERMLVAVEVKRRKRKRVPFLPTGGKGEYMTYICLSGNTYGFYAYNNTTTSAFSICFV
jgi:hypothetical protein